MKLSIVRHGETNYSSNKKLISTTDTLLNENGIKQSLYLRELLKNKEFDFIISSPLLRAKQTAKIINEVHKLKILYDNRLCERDYGEFEEMKIEDFDFVTFWECDNKNYERAESLVSFLNRTFSFFEELKNKCNDKKILIVAHGSINVALSAYFAKEIPNNLLDVSSKIENMEVIEYEY